MRGPIQPKLTVQLSLGSMQTGTPRWPSESEQAVNLDDERSVFKLRKARSQRVPLLVIGLGLEDDAERWFAADAGSDAHRA